MIARNTSSASAASWSMRVTSSTSRIDDFQRSSSSSRFAGALTAALVERLGMANVSGVDPSQPFAEACGARLPGVEVAVAAAESLPFGDGAFDASLSQLVVNFMGDAEAGVREMARVTRPGGVVASCVWDYAGEMTLLRAFWDAAREVDPDRGAAADAGGQPALEVSDEAVPADALDLVEDEDGQRQDERH